MNILIPAEIIYLAQYDFSKRPDLLTLIGATGNPIVNSIGFFDRNQLNAIIEDRKHCYSIEPTVIFKIKKKYQ